MYVWRVSVCECIRGEEGVMMSLIALSPLRKMIIDSLVIVL